MTEYFILKDRKAIPVSSLEEWAKAYVSDRHVAQDYVGDVRISTVFLRVQQLHPEETNERIVTTPKHDLAMAPA